MYIYTHNSAVVHIQTLCLFILRFIDATVSTNCSFLIIVNVVQMKHLYSSPQSQLTGRKVLPATPHSHPIPFLLSLGYTDAYKKYLIQYYWVFFRYKHELTLSYQSLTQRSVCRCRCLCIFFTTGMCILAILSLEPDHTKKMGLTKQNQNKVYQNYPGSS